MTDIVDIANDLAQRERDDALAAHHARRPAQASGSSRGRCCVDCGRAIPAKRLEANPAATRCIDHARAQETRLKTTFGARP